MDRSGNRRSPPPVRRTTLLYLGVTTGVLALRRYQIWRPLHRGLVGIPVAALATAPEHPEVVFAASGSDIYHSADGGTRWRRVGQAPAEARVRSLLAGPRAVNRLLAGLEPAAIAYSDNGGVMWRSAALPSLPTGAITRLLPPIGEGGLLYALVAEMILASDDGGARWQIVEALRAPVAAVAQHPDAPGTLYAGGPAGLFRTRNGGRAWQRLTSAPIAALLVHPNRPRTLLAALPDGLHQSQTAGAQWQPMAGGEATDDPVVDLAGNAVGEIVLARTRAGRLLQLVDGRWQPPLMGPAPPVLTALAASGEVSPWPGTPKRSQTRRKRPARKDGGVAEATGSANPSPSPRAAPPAS